MKFFPVVDIAGCGGVHCSRRTTVDSDELILLYDSTMDAEIPGIISDSSTAKPRSPF
jgi:hypothetical protein